MTDLLTENARLRAALKQIVALNIAASLPWTHEQAADNYWRMIDAMKGVASAALATPAPDAPDLTDPVVVHANMLRGTIAKPSVAQIIHLYGSAVFLEMLHKLGLCRPTTHDAQSGVYWCAACRNTNAIHCAHPDECGNMRRITRDEIAAQADSWKAWLDDLPLPEFQAAIDGLQDYLTIVVNALFTLNIEDEQPKPPAPDAVQEAARVERVACAMWKAEADRAAPNVGRNRTPEMFVNELHETRAKWLGLADAALRAIAGDRT